MKHLDSYDKNLTFLENNYEFITNGTNKRVYRRTVVDFFKSLNIIQNFKDSIWVEYE